MQVVTLPPLVNSDHLIRWKRPWHRTIPLAPILQPHAPSESPTQEENDGERSSQPEDNPGEYPTPTQVRTPICHQISI